jgi:hypothetical protein
MWRFLLFLYWFLCRLPFIEGIDVWAIGEQHVCRGVGVTVYCEGKRLLFLS